MSDFTGNSMSNFAMQYTNVVSRHTTSNSMRQEDPITVLEETNSEDEYASTVEDNSRIAMETTSLTLKTISHTSTKQSQNQSVSDLSIRKGHVYPKKAIFQQMNKLNTIPEMSPLLLRINSLKKATIVNIARSRRTSNLIQLVHLVQAKKHIGKPQIVYSLEESLECYELLPSFSVNRAEEQFILTSEIENVNVLVLPVKQKIKNGTLVRNSSTPELLLPPEGPCRTKVLQPLWESITFTIAFGKHVAIEYNIPQVSIRKVKYYKAEKQIIQLFKSAILYHDIPQEPLVIYKAAQIHQIRLTTVELQDPHLVHYIKVEQNH